MRLRLGAGRLLPLRATTFRWFDYFLCFLASAAGWRACGWLLCRLVFLAQLVLALQDQCVTGNCATAVTSFAYAEATVSCYAWLESK